MKVTIHAGVPGAKLHHLVPPAYRDALVEAAPEAEGTYALLLFAHAPRDVVPSSAVRRALRRLGDAGGATPLAVGTVFTDEALALLGEVGARVVTYRRAHWTDATARGRQL
jgi:hypothetical protein